MIPFLLFVAGFMIACYGSLNYNYWIMLCGLFTDAFTAVWMFTLINIHWESFMAKYRDSDCVGCEYCRNCGRKEKYWVVECDVCGDQIPEGEEKTENGKDYCRWCWKEKEENEE